jgi:adenylate cyclase class 2
MVEDTAGKLPERIMLEVEMKFPIVDADSLREQLQARGARLGETRTEEDRYFNAPDRDFAKTDEALRIRRIGNASYFTYKGPKRDKETKTRTEIELPIQPGDAAAEQAAALLIALGYRYVATIKKIRTVYHLTHAQFAVAICIDAVEGVGSFAELEILAAENQLEPARAAVLALAKQLSLSGSERRSYLEMWLEEHRGA